MGAARTLTGVRDPDWASDGRDWPNRQLSRFVDVGASRFHVQIGGEGPILCLLHGAGASTHSFRDLLPRLATRFRVVAPDLPGHGFTRVSGTGGETFGLDSMSGLVADLLSTLHLEPSLVVGHSAGAAIGLRAILDGRLKPELAVGLNAALLPFRGVARIFAPAARFAAKRPITAQLAAWSATDRRRVCKTLEGTGSTIDARGVELYQRLARRSGHVFGTVRMMAAWDLVPLGRDLSRLQVPLRLVVGREDKAIPPEDAREIARRVPDAEIVFLDGLGHLAHEEAPERTFEVVLREAARRGLLSQQAVEIQAISGSSG